MASMARPNSFPRPPADFAARSLPIDTIAAGTALHRIHRSDLGALFFGKTGLSRFDDPQRGFGVCYLALSVEGAFAETCLRKVGHQFVPISFLDARAVTGLSAARPIRLAALHGPGLVAIGTTSAIAAGSYADAQAWAAAIHDHADAVDGLIYRANHDNGEHCIALFERAADAIITGDSSSLTGDRRRLSALLARYRVVLG